MSKKTSKSLVGKLKHKIELIANYSESDHEEENWVKIEDAYAEILALSETSIKEFDGLNFGHVMFEEYYLLTTRYTPHINYKMRIRFGRRIFIIKRIINPYEINQLLKIIVLEITEK